MRLLFFVLLLYSTSAYSQLYPRWGDQGNGTYVNPILPGDFSDLDAIKVGTDYYAISSTMQFAPGMVVLHSTDLVNWEIVGHVVKDLRTISPELNWDRMNRYGRGVWAGSIRYYKNRYWVYFGTPDEGFFMSSAASPAGPWDPIHPLWRVSGWDDCCSFMDDDGKLYFIATHFEKDSLLQKEYTIHLFRLTDDGKSLRFDTDSIIHQSKGSEANKLYKIRGYYYHFFSEVNEQGQRYVMMGRSKTIYGPYELKQVNRVNRVKDREPNQGALLEANGKWYFLTHHGRGDWEGRPASLLPVSWINDWPILGKPSEERVGEMVWEGQMPLSSVKKRSLQTSDEFNADSLGVQWEWNYQDRREKWSLTEKRGFLRLYGFPPQGVDTGADILLRAGNTLTQRSLRASYNTATVKLHIANGANGMVTGLAHFSTAGSSWVGVVMDNGKQYLSFHINGNQTKFRELKQPVIWLRSTWDTRGVNIYWYSLNGRDFNRIGPESTLQWGSYRGDRISLFHYNTNKEQGYVEADWFRYSFK